MKVKLQALASFRGGQPGRLNPELLCCVGERETGLMWAVADNDDDETTRTKRRETGRDDNLGGLLDEFQFGLFFAAV